MSKELYIAAHEDLIEQYMEAHPEADWTKAYEATAYGAWDRMKDRLADRIDEYRTKWKEQQ